jgi:hypothetical protein
MQPMILGVILPAAIIAKNEKMKKDFSTKWFDPARECLQNIMLKLKCQNSIMVAPTV